MISSNSFKEFYEASFLNGDNQIKAKKLANDFFIDFINYTPEQLKILDNYISNGQIDLFYMSLANFKYLIEFSDDLSRYWHVLRGYSSALSKLKTDFSVKGSKKLSTYYFSKYGDRRFLRNEHWFEKKRWEFLDELQNIYSDEELESFYQKYKQELAENLKIYTSFIMLFIKNIEIRKTHLAPANSIVKI